MNTVGHLHPYPFQGSQFRPVPIVLSPTCQRRVPAAAPSEVDRELRGAPMVLRRGENTYELCCPGDWAMAMTWDGQSLVVQEAYHLVGRSKDLIARTMVARHARFDPDARMFVAPFGVDDDQNDDGISPRVQLVWPENWGFEKAGRGDRYQWTGNGLFGMEGLPSRPPSPGRSMLTRQRFVDAFAEIDAGRGQRQGAKRGDPFHCARQLAKARAIAEARNTPYRRVACAELAVALGRCRLFGVELEGDADFTLTPTAAKLAAEDALHVLKANVYAAWYLPQSVTLVRAYHERELALDRLESRMDLWAMFMAIDEAFEATAGQCDRELASLVDKMGRMAARLDANLQQNIEILRLAAGTRLLANWRRLLAPWHREALPWWLDGCLG